MRCLVSGVAVGVSIVVVLATLNSHEGEATPYLDPAGDTFGGTGNVQLDITTIDAQYGGGQLTVIVGFANAIQPPWAGAGNSAFGSVYLDTDRDASTGAPVADIGAEFTVHLVKKPGIVDVIATDSLHYLPVTGTVAFTNTGFTATIPLNAIGNSSGLLDYFVSIGTPDSAPGSEYVFLTDEAPNWVRGRNFCCATSEPAAASPTAAAASPTAEPTTAPAELPAGGAAPGSSAGARQFALAATGLLLAGAAAASLRRLMTI